MRSKAYCLFVLLTSVAFNFVIAQCPSPPTTIGDCPDDPLAVNDVEWSFATAFNKWKHIPKQNRDYVEVDFNRALSVEKTGGPYAGEMVTFEAENKENCKKVIFRDDGTSNTPKVPNNSGEIKHKLDKKTFVAVFEPECRLRAKISSGETLAAYTMRHNFARNVKSETLEDKFWKGKTEKELGNYIVASHDDEGEVNPEIKEFNNFFPFLHRNQSGLMHKCHHLCKEGHLFEFKTAFGLPFANTFKVNKDCKWMTIFLNNEPKNKMAGAEISFRHGFVTLPMEVKAFPMDFETYDPKVPDGYTVTVLYHQDKDKIPHLTIANSHGQAVKSTAVLPSTPQIYFEFEHDDKEKDCLASVIGQEMVKKGGDGSDKNDMVMKEHDFLNNMNLGFMVSKYENFESYGYSKDQGQDKERFKPSESWVSTYCDGIGCDKEPDPEEGEPPVVKPPTRTDPPPVVNTDLTPPPPPHVEAGTVFTKKDADELNNMKELIAKQEAERQRVMGSKYYLYWAIPAGFGAGSIASFIICNIIMFVMRRSVCTFWYKAMYKRYGSDTTMGAGTTMGKTGGGETIGGGTTAGSTTAGGTTAGETVGSTTAA